MVSTCDIKKGLIVSNYGGKVKLTYGCRQNDVSVPNKRMRERFALNLLRLSRCGAYGWSYGSKQVEWQVSEISVEPAQRSGDKPTRFTITLEVADAHENCSFVTATSLEAFEKKMLDLASASTHFLSPATAYYGAVSLELNTWLL